MRGAIADKLSFLPKIPFPQDWPVKDSKQKTPPELQ